MNEKEERANTNSEISTANSFKVLHQDAAEECVDNQGGQVTMKKINTTWGT